MVGLFVIAGIAAIVIALFTLTDAAMFRGRYVVTTVVPDAAGIRKGDPVLMRGVNIGRVQRFDIDKDKVARSAWRWRGSTRSRRTRGWRSRARGCSGAWSPTSSPGSPTSSCAGARPCPEASGAGMFDKVNDLSASADKALGRVQALLSDTTVRNIESGSTELDQLLKELTGYGGRAAGRAQEAHQPTCAPPRKACRRPPRGRSWSRR